MTRRNFAKALALAPGLGYSQGIATRNISPQPRGKPSGKPFEARFIDIAAQAGLTLPITYGTDDRKSFIIEAVGCGAAFIDYDNDGWLDLFLHGVVQNLFRVGRHLLKATNHRLLRSRSFAV